MICGHMWARDGVWRSLSGAEQYFRPGENRTGAWRCAGAPRNTTNLVRYCPAVRGAAFLRARGRGSEGGKINKINKN